MTRFLIVILPLFSLILWESTSFAEEDPKTLLERNEIAKLETLLAAGQVAFERGEYTEIKLRNTFRPFYDLSPTGDENLQRWAANNPKSYVAHLALGIRYRRRGVYARGDKYVSQTSAQSIAKMRNYFQLAEAELRSSMSLTAKPYLSVFNLIDIIRHIGPREEANRLVKAGIKMLPSNMLVRGRYAFSLLPRWGGTYAQLDAFIEETSRQSVPDVVVLGLKAIKEDDIGFTYQEARNVTLATQHFETALQLGQRIGGTFSEDFLTNSRTFICVGDRALPYCR